MEQMRLDPIITGGLCDGSRPLLSLRAAKFAFELLGSRLIDHSFNEVGFRGKIGFHLKRMCCLYPDFRRTSCEACLFAGDCLYVSLFSPFSHSVSSHGKTRQTPPPVQPFVISFPLINGKTTLHPANPSEVNFTLFGPAIHYSDRFLQAAAEAVEEFGLDLLRIRTFSPVEDKAPTIEDWIRRETVSSRGPVTLRFLTPARIVEKKRTTGKALPFPTVLKSIVRRLRDLKRAFGDDEHMGNIGSPFYETAAQVETERCRLSWKRKKRFSYRQKQPVFLDGITGEICYSTPAGCFLPILLAGKCVHVGKGTSCGNGKMEVIPGNPPY